MTRSETFAEAFSRRQKERENLKEERRLFLPEIAAHARESRGAGLWIVVEYGNVGKQLAYIERSADVGDRYVYAKKWRKNGQTLTQRLKIDAGSIIRIATPNDIKRAGLTQVGGR